MIKNIFKSAKQFENMELERQELLAKISKIENDNSTELQRLKNIEENYNKSIEELKANHQVEIETVKEQSKLDVANFDALVEKRTVKALSKIGIPMDELPKQRDFSKYNDPSLLEQLKQYDAPQASIFFEKNKKAIFAEINANAKKA